MARRSNGEGSVGKRKDGRWMARFYITCPNGVRKRVCLIKKKKSEVVAAMQYEMRQAAQGTPITHDGRTVAEWLDHWHKQIDKNKVKLSTWYLHEQHIRINIKPLIGHVRMDNLAPHHVQGMIESLLKRGASARTCQLARNTLSAALKCALNREVIHRNVARMVDVPESIRKEREIWTKDQLNQFLEAAQDSQYFPAFKLLCTYGLRRGEALGLRWCDVNFENKTISIEQQLIESGKHIFIGTTKTNAGKRTLPLTADVEAILADYPRKGDNDSLIFQTRNGTPLQPNNLYRLFQQISAKAGLPRIAVHDLRHSVATAMKEANVPIKDAQMILGHADPTTTMRIYQHSSLDSKKNALDRLAASL